VVKGSASDLDLEAGCPERNRLAIRFTTHAGRITDRGRVSHVYEMEISGRFNTQNEPVVATLDTIALDTLSTTLRDRDHSCNSIHLVSLICGYMSLLCSTIGVTEQVSTTMDGIACMKEQTRFNLHVHLQFFMFCRLSGLLAQSIDNIRLELVHGHKSTRSENAFAAAGVLRYTVAYFRRSLRYGFLSRLNHVSLESSITLSHF
jgi:hypothetical protein